MDISYNPGRGFFVGKRTICIMVLVIGAILFPSYIKADASSTSTPINPPEVWITAYASVPQETSDHPFITASGERVRDGIVAANFLPFGTEIEIPSLFGDKVFTVEDRMNRKFSGRVDIWMPSVNDAIDFGIRHAQVVILNSDLADAK
jgi:3D (Asp-Asp-Asp) domain-containing protein